jgi:ketosteroid isomerase-like protein
MRRILLPTLSLLLISACTRAPMKDHAMDREIIYQNIQDFSYALTQGNRAELAKVYTEDARIFPPNRDILRGSESIGAYWNPKETGDWHTTEHRIIPDTIAFEGQIAYDYGYYKGQSTNGEQVSDWMGKYVIVWEEVAPDIWKMKLDSWNRVSEENAPQWLKDASYEHESAAD